MVAALQAVADGLTWVEAGGGRHGAGGSSPQVCGIAEDGLKMDAI